MHEDLLSALLTRCPRDTVFVGDLRGDVEDVRHAVQLARSRVVVGVLRISRAADALGARAAPHALLLHESRGH